jgi:hypothetical protein
MLLYAVLRMQQHLLSTLLLMLIIQQRARIAVRAAQQH